ncbi:MAG TPA: hypothetical protein VI318_13880 [Baekduia sp.]
MAALIVAGALMLGVAASAGASTVTVSPGGNVTGTATTHAFFQWGSARLDCAAATATGTLRAATGVFPITVSSNMQENFSSCTLVGIGGYTITCSNTSTANVTSVTVAGVTQGTIANIACTVTVVGICSARMSGSLTESNNNATGQVTVNAAGQSLVVSGSMCGSLLPNGPMTFTGPSSANLVYNVLPRQTVTAT